MDINRLEAGDWLDDFDRTAVYRVRLWVRPQDPKYSWMVDDWEITDASDVEEVVSWARAASSQGAFEVFVIAESDSGSAGQSRLIRLYGAPVEGPGATRTVDFTQE